jgi:hypothetical protein
MALDSLGDVLRNREVIHKESSKEITTETTGQIDNLKKYSKRQSKSTRQSDKGSQPDKVIAREANYIKNLAIDDLYDRLVSLELVMDHKYKAFWCGAIHTLGTSFVEAQAHHALQYGKSPAALFHFLVNKALNKSSDPLMPRFKSR